MAATEEPVPMTEMTLEPVVENKAENGVKTKKAKEPKAKKPRSPPSHPPYIEVLIIEANFWLLMLNFTLSYCLLMLIDAEFSIDPY